VSKLLSAVRDHAEIRISGRHRGLHAPDSAPAHQERQQGDRRIETIGGWGVAFLVIFMARRQWACDGRPLVSGGGLAGLRSTVSGLVPRGLRRGYDCLSGSCCAKARFHVAGGVEGFFGPERRDFMISPQPSPANGDCHAIACWRDVKNPCCTLPNSSTQCAHGT
jgi:hypothetical protein